ncbi:hypothetical protein [Amycolatopsis nigrescens]|uniref:hypothetical protein n=1 Tax=Amycolatopsis nigrescens TaxID=381445 RepID=UPI00037F77DD|nr:hypothetical protein [Amycolatopsis nigrescens]
MAWQEELRKLDEELASGKLTADEYRARRDQVLSSAVNPGEQPPAPAQATSQAGETQIIQPVSPPQGTPQQQSPQQQPPQQFQPQQQPPGSPEATQVVSGQDTGAERTQVVPSWQTRPPQHPNSPPGGFQQPPGQQSPPHGFPPPQGQQQPGQAWNAPQEDVSPPWGGAEFPPLSPSRSSDWVAQGPETFETKSSSGSGKKILFSVLGLVVVAGIGLAVWLLFIKDSGSDTPPPNAQTSSPQPPPASSVKPLPEPPPAKADPTDNSSALIDAPGTPRLGGGELDITTLQNNKLLPESVTSALAQAGMTDGVLKTSTDGPATIGLYALTVSDEQSAVSVAQEYANTQLEGGIKANRDLSLKGVPVFSAASETADSAFRAVYVLYNRVIIVETFGKGKDAVQQQFETVLNNQVQLAPPTQRT